MMYFCTHYQVGRLQEKEKKKECGLYLNEQYIEDVCTLISCPCLLFHDLIFVKFILGIHGSSKGGG